MKHFDFYVVPVANPDGYEYTWTTNRMWRKNRSSRGRSSAAAAEEPAVEEVEVQTKQFWPGFQFPGFGGQQQQQQQPSWPGQPQYPVQQQPQRPGRPAKGCDGVDPNRNFDIGFATVGSSSICSKDTYHGPGAFSEAESRAIRDAVRSIKSRQKLVSFVSVHAYSQLWMLPYGYTKTRAGDYKDLMRVAGAATNALRSTYGTSYKYGPINEVIYQAAGSSVDWAYAKENVKYSYALELRDTGRHGFLLPVSQIEPTVKETYAGLKAMAEEMAKEY